MFTPAKEMYQNTIDTFDEFFIKQKINDLSQIIKDAIDKTSKEFRFELTIKFTEADKAYHKDIFMVCGVNKSQQQILVAVVKPQLIAAGYNICIDTHTAESTQKYSTTFYINFIT